MLSWKKSNSIVTMLHNREINYKYYSSNYSGLQTVRRLISSDSDLYSKHFTSTSQSHIAFENGILYLENYKQFCPLNVVNRKSNALPPFFSMEDIDAENRFDAVSYSGKFQDIDHVCESEQCVCLSPCLISIFENKWMCQHLLKNGRLVKRVYLDISEPYIMMALSASESCGRCSFSFSNLNDDSDKQLLVFKYPLEFFSRMEIKTSVFGIDIRRVKLFNEFLIISRKETGATNSVFDFYHFDDFIKQGKYTFVSLAFFKLF